MKLLLVTPPLVQLNTPYPATPYLTDYLTRQGWDVVQADAGLLWALRLFSQAGLEELVDILGSSDDATRAKPSVAHLLAHAQDYVQHSDVALAILQGRELGLAHRIAARTLFPEGPRFAQIAPAGHEEQYLEWAFGSMSVSDKARYFATLFVEDVADAIVQGIDPHFALARYAESLAQSPPTLDPLLAELDDDTRLTTRILEAITRELYARYQPDVVGMTLPFPGNVLGALRMAKVLRRQAPNVKIVWGGGFVNTELRELDDPRLFTWIDAICYDDGERPLALLLEYFAGQRDRSSLLRTRLCDNGQVVWVSDAHEHDVPFAQSARPSYAGLPLMSYLGLIDMLNPMHRLWHDTRWNKLTVAHGCYWRKCSFCDLSLDYIARFEPLSASLLVDRIEAVIAETGSRGFHFVDEAAPPAVLAGLADELKRRGLAIAWWTNIRFEKTFTPELCRTLADAGCIAVTGGLEVASNRLLKLMNKGVTVEQVARVTKAFADAKVRVHAYLMYGFASQTVQETVDSLEYVRQLFATGCLESAFWHRLSTTAHSPLGREPERFGIRITEEPLPVHAKRLARNDLDFSDATGVDHDALGVGLHKAVYNYMLGLGFDDDVRMWFSQRVPKTRVPKDFIERALDTKHEATIAKRRP